MIREIWCLIRLCGSGPIFSAAKELNVTAIGIDRNEVAISLCYDRLAENRSKPVNFRPTHNL